MHERVYKYYANLTKTEKLTKLMSINSCCYFCWQSEEPDDESLCRLLPLEPELIDGEHWLNFRRFVEPGTELGSVGGVLDIGDHALNDVG